MSRANLLKPTKSNVDHTILKDLSNHQSLICDTTAVERNAKTRGWFPLFPLFPLFLN